MPENQNNQVTQSKLINIAALITPQQFAKRMLDFYQARGRKDLPWQENPTPYRVWISEIMLQQTQVKTVIPYYEKFMQSFTTVDALAKANVDDVLHHWQGLGYYSRARNLHKCAQTIVNEFNGEFPDNLEKMESLPGIGRSTAGAILSLALAKPTPILDGNVKRVLARVFLVDGWYGRSSVAKELWQLTEAYTPKKQTGNFNQAMMDLGASLCSRGKPKCEECPLKDHCLAFIHAKTVEYPHRKPKKEIPIRHATFELIVNDKHQIQLVKRPPTGIWGGLWSMPEQPIELAQTTDKNLIDEFRHTFTHFHLEMKFVNSQVNKTTHKLQESDSLAWHNIDKLTELAFPTPIKKFLFKHFELN